MTNETIETLEVERSQNLDRAKTVAAIAKDGDRDLTAEEQASQAAYLDRVEAIDKELETLSRIERLEASRAVPVEADAAEAPARITVGDKHREPGTLFAAQAVALHRNSNDRTQAARFAREVWDDELLARVLETPPAVLERATQTAADTTTAGWAAEIMVEYKRQADEFIELLRPMTVLTQITPRRLTFDGTGSIKIPKQSAGVSGGWISELGAIPVGELTTAEITLTPAKLGVIVVVSQEAINQSDPQILQVVRDDMLAGTAQPLDALFVSNTAASAPAPAGILNGITPESASAIVGGSDLDDATADLKGLEAELAAANVPGPWTWIMHSSAYNSLLYMRETGTGVYAFRDELRGGTLSGHRVVVSNNVTSDDVILVAENQILYATGRAPEVSLTNEASLHMSDTPDANLNTGAGAGPVTTTPVRSLFQTDSVASRILSSWGWGRRHDAAIAWVAGVGWL